MQCSEKLWLKCKMTSINCWFELQFRYLDFFVVLYMKSVWNTGEPWINKFKIAITIVLGNVQRIFIWSYPMIASNIVGFKSIIIFGIDRNDDR